MLRKFSEDKTQTKSKINLEQIKVGAKGQKNIFIRR